MSNTQKGLRYVLAAALISGISIFANKFFVGSYPDPYVFTTVKNALVAVFLFAALAMAGDIGQLKSLRRNEWLKLMAIGLVGGSVPFLLFFKGLSMTSAASGAFIQKTMFLYVGLLAMVFLKERLNMKHLCAAFAILAANAAAIGLNVYTVNAGDALVFAATLLWAAETVIAKKALSTVKPSIVAGARMIFGSAILLAFVSSTGRLGAVYALTSNQILAALASSIILLLYVVAWFGGLKGVNASTATVVLLLGSPITTALSLASFGHVPYAELAGGLLLAAAVAAYVRLTPQLKEQHAAA